MKKMALIISLSILALVFGGCGKEKSPEPGARSRTAKMPAVHMLLPNMGGKIEGLSEVEAAINEITEAELGIHVIYEMLTWEDYMTQMPKRLIEDASADLILLCGFGDAGFERMLAQGLLRDITDFVCSENFAARMVAEKFLPATTVDGCIYGIPVLRNLVNNNEEYIFASQCFEYTWAIPEASEHFEPAKQLLDLLYTDERINNLMAWGIEGRDYMIKDGTAKILKDTMVYHGSDQIVGNQFMTLPPEGRDAGCRRMAMERLADVQFIRENDN